MTQQEVVDHWKKGAQDSLDVAQMCLKAKKYEHALFNAHLAVEKVLKARYIAEKDTSPPYTHELHDIVPQMNINLPEDQMNLLREMSRLAVRARYADHRWSSEQATESNATYWVNQAEIFLSFFLSL
jgi:HEPN domain-containing protein